MIEYIAFDADDTLWHNEIAYIETTRKFNDLLAAHYDLTGIDGEVYQTEIANIPLLGYGVKEFIISMIETAVRLTGGGIEGRHVLEIAQMGKEMLARDVDLMEGAEGIVSALAASYPLMLITKGDQFEQESKIARSGIAHYFKYIEVVSDKTRETYQRLLDKYRIAPSRFLMVGNSLRSDILPVISMGGQAVYIHYELTWEHESVHEDHLQDPSYYQINSMSQLPEIITAMTASE